MMNLAERSKLDQTLKIVECTHSNMSGFQAILRSLYVFPNNLLCSDACSYGYRSITGRGLVRVYTNGEESFYDLLFHGKDDLYIAPVMLRHQSMFEVAKKLGLLLGLVER